jgi:hypothetical protein
VYTDYYGRKWYKGNLHTHTALSDGALSYEQVVARYRHAGYDFLAVTDHWIASRPEESPDFLLLSGCEYSFYYTSKYRNVKRTSCIHINGTGFAEPPHIKPHPELTPREVVDAIHKTDGLAVFNHPIWSRNTVDDLWTAEGYDGVEIYNSFVDWNFLKLGYAGEFVDQLAFGRRMLPVFAADDSHSFNGEEFNAFIMVQAEDLTRKDILKAIREHKFFASQRPWVQAVLDGNIVRVECTPVSHIRLLTNLPSELAFGGQRMTGARFSLPDEAYYYRVEVTDENGKSAWISPTLR